MGHFRSTRIITPSQLPPDRMAALQEVCEFDLGSAPLGWMRMTVLKHDTLLRKHGLDGRQGEMGIRYEITEQNVLSGKHRMICSAHGHDANPRATQFIYEQRMGQDVSDYNVGEREWLEEVANWHKATEATIAAGRDPRRPAGANTISEPCLARLIRHHGMEIDDFLALAPRQGQFIVGGGWRRTTPAPRVVEIGGLQAHLVRTAGRIEVERIGLADGLSYDPPKRDKSRRVGILYALRLEVPDTIRNALIGEPLDRLVRHAALDPGLRIRAISRSGSGIAVRVDGCHAQRTMDQVD